MAPQHSRRSTSARAGARVSVPIALTVVLVLGSVGGGAVWYAQRHRSALAADEAVCASGPTVLSVAAAPDLAGVLAPLLATGPVPCARVVLAQTDSAEMARFLAGTATVSDLTAKPDVWIPDSTLWLDVARSTDRGQATVPHAGSSVADSPTVVAAPKPVADLLGGQGGLG